MTTDALRELRVALLETPEESCAVLIATSVVVDGQLVRLCVREVVYPSSEDYLVRTTIEARLRPQFLAEITQRVRGSRESLVFVHSHPFALNSFSPTDDLGEMKLDEFLRARTPGTTHAAMLVTPEHTCARILGQKTPLRVIGVGARVMWATMLVPGLGCLMCGPLLSPEKVRVDLLSEDERRRDPYVVGAKEPAPAVISLNATVSSMAVTMFLASAIGVPSEARSINYNAITGMTRAASITANPNCYVCSPRGIFARGDTFAAPGRMACEAVPTKNE